MIEYIYFVKCPSCEHWEDEHFSFFNDAKDFALSCLSNKPIITQIEVDRNDFGECVDSQDLGTVWSWEDVMSDVPSKPEFSVLDKSTTLDCDDIDAEFDSLDNNVSVNIDDLSQVPDNFRNPMEIHEAVKLATNKRGDYLVKAESGHGYTVFNQNDCWIGGINGEDDEKAIQRFNNNDLDESISRKPIPKNMTIKELVEEMEENEDEVECKWCHELFDKSECNYEVDLGWLCDQCTAAIRSRGESLTFSDEPLEESATEVYSWDAQPVELEYNKLDVTLQGVEKQSSDPYEPPYRDEWDETVSYTYEADPTSVVEFLWDIMTDEDVAEIPGGFEAMEADDALFNSFMNDHFDELVTKYMDKLLIKFENDARRDYEDSYNPYEAEANARADYWDSMHHDYFDESCNSKAMLEELEEAEDYNKRLIDCPECGNLGFDSSTGICIKCGFN